MREIIPNRIWIGNARDARDVAAVLSREIRAVVDLAMEEVPACFPREIISCRFPLIDGSGNAPDVLQAVVRTLAALVEAEIPTLVTCGGGMSRSPAVVAAALSLVRGGSPDEWLQQIASSGPHDVAPALWNDLRQFARNP